MSAGRGRSAADRMANSTARPHNGGLQQCLPATKSATRQAERTAAARTWGLRADVVDDDKSAVAADVARRFAQIPARFAHAARDPIREGADVNNSPGIGSKPNVKEISNIKNRFKVARRPAAKCGLPGWSVNLRKCRHFGDIWVATGTSILAWLIRIFLDLGVAQEAPDKRYPIMAYVRVYMGNPREEGYPVRRSSMRLPPSKTYLLGS